MRQAKGDTLHVADDPEKLKHRLGLPPSFSLYFLLPVLIASIFVLPRLLLLIPLLGTIDCDAPNADLYKFSGKLTLENGKEISLTNNEVVLRVLSLLLISSPLLFLPPFFHFIRFIIPI